jgi:hypothetical protein
MMQLEHVMGGAIHHKPYHVEVIKGSLTRYISSQMSDMHDEIMKALSEEFSDKNGKL